MFLSPASTDQGPPPPVTVTVTWSLPRVEVHVPPEVQATCLNIGCRVYMLSADASSKQPTVEGEGGGGGDGGTSWR